MPLSCIDEIVRFVDRIGTTDEGQAIYMVPLDVLLREDESESDGLDRLFEIGYDWFTGPVPKTALYPADQYVTIKTGLNVDTLVDISV